MRWISICLNTWTSCNPEISMIYELTKLEVEAKEIRAMNACVKVANFPFIKTMNDFDFSFQPTLNRDMIRGFTDLRFIKQKENILFIGSPDVGKTHLSVAIGVESAKHKTAPISYTAMT